MRDRRFPPIFMDNHLRRLFSPPEKLVSKYVLKSQVVADLGCGPGYFALPLAKIVGQEGGKVYAVDFDAKSIERLTAKASKHGLDKIIEAHVSSASNVGFIPDASVDFIFANGLLCCMTDHLGVVREIKRILKLEGSAYLSVTKFARKRDPRTVSKQEWGELLSANFDIQEEGEGLLNRWALVSVPGIKGKELITEGQRQQESKRERKKQRAMAGCNCCAPS